jgi:aminomethyltransferase
VALGYVRSDFALHGTKLELIVRDKAIAGIVSPMPFIPHRYAR